MADNLLARAELLKIAAEIAGLQPEPNRFPNDGSMAGNLAVLAAQTGYVAAVSDALKIINKKLLEYEPQ